MDGPCGQSEGRSSVGRLGVEAVHHRCPVAASMFQITSWSLEGASSVDGRSPGRSGQDQGSGTILNTGAQKQGPITSPVTGHHVQMSRKVA